MSARLPTWDRKKLPGMTLDLTLADRESRLIGDAGVPVGPHLVWPKTEVSHTL